MSAETPLTSQSNSALTESASNQSVISTPPQVQACANCGAPLNGPYCHICGQSSRSMIKFIGELIQEVVDNLIGYDSRLRHSLIPLFIKPGHLTNEYIKGRRYFYVLPLRLYLITSLVFMLLLGLSTPTELQMAVTSDGKAVIVDSSQNESTNKQALEPPTRPVPTSEQNPPVDKGLAPANAEGTDSQQSIDDADNDVAQDQNFGVLLEGEDLKFQGKAFESGPLKEFADDIEVKWQSWRKDPAPLIKQVIEILPYMMLGLLPIFAIVMKCFYLFARRYYIEHLIFLFHNHSFIYIALMMEMGLDWCHQVLGRASFWGSDFLQGVTGLLENLIGWWIPIYVLIAMRRVYQQGWGLTIVKYFVLGFSYIMLISCGFLITLAIGAVLA